MSGQIGRLIEKSADRIKQIEQQVAETRCIESVFAALRHPLLPPNPWLGEPLRLLAEKDGRNSSTNCGGKYRSRRERTAAKSLLEMLANQILAYHTANSYNKMGGKDPNSLENFRELLNKVAVTAEGGCRGPRPIDEHQRRHRGIRHHARLASEVHAEADRYRTRN